MDVNYLLTTPGDLWQSTSPATPQSGTQRHQHCWLHHCAWIGSESRSSCSEHLWNLRFVESVTVQFTNKLERRERITNGSGSMHYNSVYTAIIRHGILLSLCAVFIVVSFKRNGVWKTENLLWHDVLAKNHKSCIAYINLALDYGTKGNLALFRKLSWDGYHRCETPYNKQKLSDNVDRFLNNIPFE